jgi:hypothetical protein
MWFWLVIRPLLFGAWGTIFAFCLWCHSQRGVFVHCILRAAFWGLGIFIALMPALHASDAEYGTIPDMAVNTNNAGFYRDFFFITTVVVGILGVSSIMDHVFKHSGGLGDWSKLVFGMMGVYFIAVVAYGVNRFGEIAKVKQVLAFGHDLSIIKYTLLAGLITEITIVLRERAP